MSRFANTAAALLLVLLGGVIGFAISRYLDDAQNNRFRIAIASGYNDSVHHIYKIDQQSGRSWYARVHHRGAPDGWSVIPELQDAWVTLPTRTAPATGTKEMLDKVYSDWKPRSAPISIFDEDGNVTLKIIGEAK